MREVFVEVWPLVSVKSRIYLMTSFEDVKLINVALDRSVFEVVEDVASISDGLFMSHSTSWRETESGIVLTFICLFDGKEIVPEWFDVSTLLVSVDRPETKNIPVKSISRREVLCHALRHTSYLAKYDDIISAKFSVSWMRALAEFEPYPAIGWSSPAQRRNVI